MESFRIYKKSILFSCVTIFSILLLIGLAFVNNSIFRHYYIGTNCKECNSDMYDDSSKPYDYIKNNKAYDKLVDLGVEAIPYIQSMLMNQIQD